MKKFAKVLSLALAVMLMALTLTACGSSGSSGMTKQFTAGSAYFIGDIGWYNSDVYTLRLIGEDSYELIFQEYRFGTEDAGTKGLRTIVYTGKCSVGESADGWETHRDVTLQPAERIIMEQHEKGYGRAAIAGHCVIDTANWTDTMTELLDPENNAMTAKDFLGKYAEKVVITVEDPSLDAEDTSLGYKIVEIPTLTLVTEAG